MGPEMGDGRPGATAVPLAAQDDSIATGTDAQTSAAVVTGAGVEADPSANPSAAPSATPSKLGPGEYISGADALVGDLAGVRAMLAVILAGVATVLVM